MNSLEAKYSAAVLGAIKASEAIMEVYSTDFSTTIKGDGSPVTQADLTSSDIITQYLVPTSIPITGEETIKKPYAIRKKWKESWCVDPLDGTKEFVRKNGEFVVSIALIRNQQPHFGVIASPVSKRIIIGGADVTPALFTFDQFENPALWKELLPLSGVNDPVVVISSRSNYAGNLRSLIDKVERKYGHVASAKMGSALKFFDLVQGKADIYPRLAPTMEWDIAAGHAIYKAIGGEVISVETNEPLVYNKESLFNPFFVALKKGVRF